MSARKSVLVLALVLLASPALAGCLSPNEAPLQGQSVDQVAPAPLGSHLVISHPGGLPVAPAWVPALVRNTTSLLLSTGHDSAEPTIGVTSNGTLFLTAASFVNPETANQTPIDHLLRSTDGGHTWMDVSARLPTGQYAFPYTGDPYVYVDPATDRVFKVDQINTECNHLAYSDDGGQTWAANPVACGPGENDHLSIAAGPSRMGTPTVGYPNIVYLCENQIYDSMCDRSLDGGQTFSQFVPVFPGVSPDAMDLNQTGPFGLANGALRGFCGGLTGHVHVGPNGTVYLPRGYCGTPYVAVSHDDGLTWQKIVVDNSGIGISGHDGSVATDAAGNAYYFWVGADGLPYLSISTDLGEHWSTPEMVGAPNVTIAAQPQIAAKGVGKVAFVYVGTTSHEGAPNATDAAMPNATWNGYMGVIPDALSPNPTVVSVRVNNATDPLVRGACPGNNRCHGMFDFLDIVIDHQGRPWASFVNTCTSSECRSASGTPADSDGNLGLVGTIASGEALTSAGGALPALPSLGSAYTG